MSRGSSTPPIRTWPIPAAWPPGWPNEAYVEALAKIVYLLGLSGGRHLRPDRRLGGDEGRPRRDDGAVPRRPQEHAWAISTTTCRQPSARWSRPTPTPSTARASPTWSADAVAVQTPADVPDGHYWTIQIVDLFTTVTHQLGSASHTPARQVPAGRPRLARRQARRLHRRAAFAHQRGRRASAAASPPIRRKRRPGRGRC